MLSPPLSTGWDLLWFTIPAWSDRDPPFTVTFPSGLYYSIASYLLYMLPLNSGTVSILYSGTFLHALHTSCGIDSSQLVVPEHEFALRNWRSVFSYQRNVSRNFWISGNMTTQTCSRWVKEGSHQLYKKRGDTHSS